MNTLRRAPDVRQQHLQFLPAVDGTAGLLHPLEGEKYVLARFSQSASMAARQEILPGRVQVGIAHVFHLVRRKREACQIRNCLQALEAVQVRYSELGFNLHGLVLEKR